MPKQPSSLHHLRLDRSAKHFDVHLGLDGSSAKHEALLDLLHRWQDYSGAVVFVDGDSWTDWGEAPKKGDALHVVVRVDTLLTAQDLALYLWRESRDLVPNTPQGDTRTVVIVSTEVWSTEVMALSVPA